MDKIAPVLSIGSIIAIVIVLAVFGVGIYFISKLFAQTCATGLQFDTTLNKCIPVCSAPQINGPNGDCQCPFPESQEGTDCLEKCDANQKRCGTGCISKTEYCINGTYCDSSKVCGDGTICCTNGETCINNKCVACPAGQIDCGGTCCTNDNCIDGSCCDLAKGDKCKDETGKDVCCEKVNGVSNCCGGICCSGTTRCNIANNKCENACKYKDVNGNDLYCGTSADVGEKCMNFDDTSRSVCVSSNCSYNPPKYSTIPISTTNGNNLETCKSVSGKDYITAFPPSGGGKQLTSSINYDILPGSTCTDKDCEDVIKNIGLLGNVTSGTSGNTCIGNFNCDKYLTYNNFPGNLNSGFSRKTTIDDINPVTLGVPSYQLCKNQNGQYTGQICGNNYEAELNGDECDCVPNSDRAYCSNRGTLTSGACVCDPGYGGDRCQVGGTGYCDAHAGYNISSGTIKPDGSCVMNAFNIQGIYRDGIAGSQATNISDQTDSFPVCCPTAHDCLQFDCPAGTTNSNWKNDIDGEFYDVPDPCFSNSWTYPTCSGTWENPHPNPAPSIDTLCAISGGTWDSVNKNCKCADGTTKTEYPFCALTESGFREKECILKCDAQYPNRSNNAGQATGYAACTIGCIRF